MKLYTSQFSKRQDQMAKISARIFQIGNDSEALAFLEGDPKMIIDLYLLYPENQERGSFHEISLIDLHESIFEYLLDELKQHWKDHNNNQKTE